MKKRGEETQRSSNRDREGRSADNVATTGWLIPFHHTKHCALNADKNTQSNKQKEKKGGRKPYTILSRWYGNALGGRESKGRMEDIKENTLRKELSEKGNRTIMHLHFHSQMDRMISSINWIAFSAHTLLCLFSFLCSISLSILSVEGCWSAYQLVSFIQ